MSKKLDANSITPSTTVITPARLAFYSTLVVAIALVLVGFGLRAFLYSSSSSDSITLSDIAPILSPIIALFVYYWFLRKKAIQYRICATTQQGTIKKLSRNILIGFLFGALWRNCVTGLATNAGVDFLKRLYTPDRPVFMLDFVGSTTSLFLAFWWLYVAPMGKHRILFGATDLQLAEAENSINASDNKKYHELKDSMDSLKEAIYKFSILFSPIVCFFLVGLAINLLGNQIPQLHKRIEHLPELPHQPDQNVDTIQFQADTTAMYVGKTFLGISKNENIQGLQSVKIGDDINGIHVGAIKCIFFMKDATYGNEQFMWRGRWGCQAGRSQYEIENAVKENGEKAYDYIYIAPISIDIQ